ncbi:DNA-binding IclR family transcriptional regulator [Streptomonospora nanhaiensis]|uniref:Glycerol operon regulatory protein n=1 Tax=Streptomonospora nanhaiensis TaxID=1323731 RepID=A0A853BVD3_9ACTN|nr:IclR family transcriptional regulator [Streptomonospora nanhaiensis]NYI99248.1 DNA-binding IclR family transcriptional regulator [Streptomonospora nanhaiensis]
MASNDHRAEKSRSTLDPEEIERRSGGEAVSARTASGGNGAPVQSVDRAITVLEILAQHGEAGVTEIAAELGVHKSTAFRLVGALERRGLVEQPGLRGKYQLGFGIIRLAGTMAAGLDLTQQSRRVCEDLASDLGETVNIAIPSGDMVVNIDQVRGASAVVSQNWIGRQNPLHSTSTGKVLLAHMRPTDQRRILRGRLERLTPDTITDPDVLRAEIEEILERGYATAVEELEVGLNAVAAPIRGLTGEVIAALSASGPSYRMDRDKLDTIGETVTKAAMEISIRMGHMESPGD